MKRLPFALAPYLLCFNALLIFASGRVAQAQSVSPVHPAPRKKIIAIGWDNPTARQFARDWKQMETQPFDGCVVMPEAFGPDNKPLAQHALRFRRAFATDRWERRWFRPVIADLRTVRSARLTDNFVEFLANPGDVDWFDDAGWREVVDHFRIAAWVARQGGCKGILFDAERYTQPFSAFSQFMYASQKGRNQHTFVAYQAKARQRGREVMRAMAAEYPNITVLTLFLNSYALDAAGRPDPQRALERDAYGLLPAFLDGCLDVAPPTVTLVDGNENAYYYNSDAEFLRAAVDIKGAPGQRLVSPQNRAKYRAQVQAGMGLYLDRYNAAPGTKYYFDPGPGATHVGRFQEHLGSALRATDEYVWLWGERGRWWPEPGALAAWENKEVFRPWPNAFPGVDTALAFACDPFNAARTQIAEREKSGAPNLARNPDFSLKESPALEGGSPDWQAGGPVAGWNSWQDEENGSRGTFAWDQAAGAAKLANVRNGCFIQTYKVRPGQRFVVAVRYRRAGSSAGEAWASIRWKTMDNKWTTTALDVALTDGNGRELAGAAIVPPDAAEMVLLLGARDQASPADAAWFDDVRVFALP